MKDEGGIGTYKEGIADRNVPVVCNPQGARIWSGIDTESVSSAHHFSLTLRMPRIPWRSVGLVLLFLLSGALGGFLIGKGIGYANGADRRVRLPTGAIACKPGPWGDLSYTPFTIAAPDDLVPVRTIEQVGTRWFLPGYTADSFVTLLQSTSLTQDQQHALLDPAVFQVRPDGIELTPTPEMVFLLPEDARSKIYQVLPQSNENDGQVNFMPKSELGEHFSGSGVSQQTMEMFKRLCIERNGYLMFSGVAAMLAQIPTYDEKLSFAKALTRQRTMVLNLRVTPTSDVDGLTAYWGKGSWNTDLRTILESMTKIPNGTVMNILMVLPPLPTAEVYDYPRLVDNPLDGPLVNRDCCWTSFNFFRETPDPNFGKMDYVLRELNTNYRLVSGDPKFGDVVMIARPDGFLVHAAIYLADDICFTKNGSTLVHPWMLSTLDDIEKQFEFQLDPGQTLTVKYFRKKGW